jgi:hypothetical protein
MQNDPFFLRFCLIYIAICPLALPEEEKFDAAKSAKIERIEVTEKVFR